MSCTTIPACKSDYVVLQQGQKLKLTNPHGNQVIDFWAFAFNTDKRNDNEIRGIPSSFVRSNKAESGAGPMSTSTFPFASGVQYFSASRTRSILSKLIPSATSQDTLYTNKSLPMLTLIEDTTSGVHDTLFGCCDRFRYHNLGVEDYEHGSCAENMHLALQKAADDGVTGADCISDEWSPDPLNIFMNVPVVTGLEREAGGGGIKCEPPTSKAGEYIVLRAEMNCVAVMSACPNDVIRAVNGGTCTHIKFEVLG